MTKDTHESHAADWQAKIHGWMEILGSGCLENARCPHRPVQSGTVRLSSIIIAMTAALLLPAQVHAHESHFDNGRVSSSLTGPFRDRASRLRL